ncbi:hypothetical protein HPB49_010760 [Dermacentor silvarum]|uniref:Uncharacterized protein n=1 Tax=Dermacentor silvarum TaxID=543639 RepID=A0ACB8CWI2_DERSI|nr:hypothetical protein HPB49_010760 [Dermacentor silvarum]
MGGESLTMATTSRRVVCYPSKLSWYSGLVRSLKPLRWRRSSCQPQPYTTVARSGMLRHPDTAKRPRGEIAWSGAQPAGLCLRSEGRTRLTRTDARIEPRAVASRAMARRRLYFHLMRARAIRVLRAAQRRASKPAIYVDAAQESAHTFAIAAVNNEGQAVSSRKISAGSTHDADEAAIALGIAASRYSFIISDSMSAIRSYMQGSVGPRASEILSEPAGKVTLIWMPAHSGNGGNEMAHRAARELINRAVEACPGPLPGATAPSHSYNEIVTAYREDRRIYPPPDSFLSRMQATDLRRAQICSVMNNPPPRNLRRQAPSQEAWDYVLKSNPQTQAGLADWVAKVAASWTPL